VSEAFGWLITSVTLGLAVGQSVAGQLVELSGPSLAFAVAGAAGLLCAGCLYGLRHTLVPTPTAPRRELVDV
jgi:MFS family permease